MMAVRLLEMRRVLAGRCCVLHRRPRSRCEWPGAGRQSTPSTPRPLCRASRYPRTQHRRPCSRQGHPLRFLFDQLSTNWQCKVLSSYNHARQGKPECLIVATQIGDSSTGAQPTGGKIDSLRGFLDCLDSDVSVSKQRYIYEPICSGKWVQFLDDISVFTNMIDRIMSKIKIMGLMEVVGGYAP